MKERAICLGIQMFNFIAGGDWNQISSMEDVFELLGHLKDAGYDGVEWCNFMLNGEYMDVLLLKEKMDTLGLRTCGLHFHFESMEKLKEDTALAVQRCKILQSPYLIFAYSTPQTFGIEPEKKETGNPFKGPELVYTPEHIDGWAREMNKVLAIMRPACEAAGIEVLYHNHADELRKGSDGKFFFDAIAADGKEVDVYWVAKGLDGKVSTALDYVRERKDTVRLLHIKDGLDGSIFPNEMCGWGKGTYPIQSEIDCAKELGLSWIVYENDEPKNFGTTGLEDAMQTGVYVKEKIRL